MPIINESSNLQVEKYWRNNPKSIQKYRFVHHFLPKEEEKSRSNFLSNISLSFYCLFFILVLGFLKFIPVVAPGVLGYASNIRVDDLLMYSNKMRSEAGVGSVVINDQLSAAAYKKAEHMFANDYWSHISPDGVEPWDFILGSGYDYIYAGENLAKNFSNSDDVVTAWMKSPTHKENLLSPNYDEIGFAVVNGVLDGYETTLVVQMFGRPQDRSHLASAPEQQDSSVKGEETSVEVPVQEEVVASERPEGSEAIVIQNPVVAPVLDVSVATKSISLIMAGFVGFLLIIDIVYSRKKGIVKFNGKTFAHLALFVVAILSIWLVLSPGAII